jgi:hypothetical protein
MRDLEARLSNRIQLTTDGHRVYLDAVESAFGSGIDYSMLVKMYGNDAESEGVHRNAGNTYHRPAESQAHLYQLRRTPEPNDANEDASFHPSNKRLLKKG